VRATGDDFNTELHYQLDNEPESDEKQAIQLPAGQGRVFVFERAAPERPKGGPAEMTYQVTVKHQTPDALPFNNTSFATFLTRERRKVLTIVDNKLSADERPPWRAWQIALDVVKTFQCDVRTAAEAGGFDDKELRGYAAVCVFQLVPS